MRLPIVRNHLQVPVYRSANSVFFLSYPQAFPENTDSPQHYNRMQILSLFLSLHHQLHHSGDRHNNISLLSANLFVALSHTVLP